MVVEVESVELAEPYAVLLAENAPDEATAWVGAIRAGNTHETAESAPTERLLTVVFRLS